MRISVTLTLTEELLGTASANPELMREFIASKRPAGTDEDEVKSLPEVDEELQKSMTVFCRLADESPFLYDYQIKGFFKDACGMLRRVKGKVSEKVKAYKKVIDGLVFVSPRKILVHIHGDGKIGTCERPLRAQTAQGERIALARSETVPAGTTISFLVELLDEKLFDALEEWLDYGQLRGLGQWRNSGKGRFSYTMDVVK